MLSKGYYDLLFFFLIVGSIIILPLVIIIKPSEDVEIPIKSHYFCYLESCDTTYEIYGSKDFSNLNDYEKMFIVKENCLKFQITEDDKKKLQKQLFKLNADTEYFVISTIKDSTMAKIKYRDYHNTIGSSRTFAINLLVPISALHRKPPEKNVEEGPEME